MDYKDIIRMALDEYSEDMARALNGLTPEDRRYQPTPDSNHIDFLVWHIARVEDGWINTYARENRTVWEEGGWAERLGLPVEGGGFGYDAEQIRDFPTFDYGLLDEYAAAVRQATLHFLEASSPAEIGRPKDSGWPELYCIGSALSHLLVEESQHVGQIAYIRGMLRGLDK
jgi:uncharacterized damage-inducible protein DinB